MYRHVLTTTAALIVSVATAATTHAGLMVTIQPSADLNDVVWTVEWEGLYSLPLDSFDVYHWDAMDPATGALLAQDPWGTTVNEIYLPNVGDPFGPAYSSGNNRGFGDGYGGVVSIPAGYGVGPDDDGNSPNDDLFVFNWLVNASNPAPNDGSFVLTIPGANLSNYNLGTYTNNPNITIIVTDTPLRSVPEPSTFALLGIGGAALGFCGWRRKRRALKAVINT